VWVRDCAVPLDRRSGFSVTLTRETPKGMMEFTKNFEWTIGTLDEHMSLELQFTTLFQVRFYSRSTTLQKCEAVPMRPGVE